jgi:recombination protein RecR
MEDPVQRLVLALKRLPGVGEKNAVRIAFYLMQEAPAKGRELAEAVTGLVERSRPCALCGAPALEERCALCADPRRDASLLCVVEKFPDMLAIEKTGEFRGLYHVLGGALAPLDGVGPERLRLGALGERVAAGGVREVILATNPSTEGEATAAYVADMLATAGVAVTRIASGIPMGGELEYADRLTVSRALAGRREMGRP